MLLGSKWLPQSWCTGIFDHCKYIWHHLTSFDIIWHHLTFDIHYLTFSWAYLERLRSLHSSYRLLPYSVLICSTKDSWARQSVASNLVKLRTRPWRPWLPWLPQWHDSISFNNESFVDFWTSSWKIRTYRILQAHWPRLYWFRCCPCSFPPVLFLSNRLPIWLDLLFKSLGSFSATFDML